MWCESEREFWCEHQNDPEAAQAVVAKGLAPGFITREKTVRFNADIKRLSFRWWVPEGTEFVTVHALRVLPTCSVWSQDYFVAVFGNKLGGERP